MIQGKNWKVFQGSNLDVLPTLEDNSIDAIVTDPPYELGFMGKKWDSSGIAYNVELWRECLRVLKPGGHLLSFGGSRTWHRIAVAIEDAGFEVRDSIAWMYGSGFPKSLDISKAIDKAAGAEREVIGKRFDGGGGGGVGTFDDDNFVWSRELDVTKAATPEAKQWEGWGTALKPAFEPVIVARKPLIGTVAENVLTYGTGGLNIDGSRIATDEIITNHSRGAESAISKGKYGDSTAQKTHQTDGQKLGRWPSNVILNPYTAELLDEQSDASRFFYVAKASKRDRNEGLDELPDIHPSEVTGRKVGSAGASNGGYAGMTETPRKNIHPTVKPTTLMEYLIKLVTPPGGVVLDPFTGSGSTGKAAILQGFDFIGIELTEEYLPIIEGRLKWAEEQRNLAEAKKDEALF